MSASSLSDLLLGMLPFTVVFCTFVVCSVKGSFFATKTKAGGLIGAQNGRMVGIVGHWLELEPNPHGLQNIGLVYSVALALLIRGPKEQAESLRDVATAFVIYSMALATDAVQTPPRP